MSKQVVPVATGNSSAAAATVVVLAAAAAGGSSLRDRRLVRRATVPKLAAATHDFTPVQTFSKAVTPAVPLQYPPSHTASHVSGEHPSYGGHCTLCGGSHWLPCTSEAVAAMQGLLDTICQHQRLDYDSSQSHADPRFALEYLFTKGPGRMLGVLLATDAAGRPLTLNAFSGQITESWHIPGWVGPVAGIINESPVYVRTRRVVDAMSARMNLLEQQAAVCDLPKNTRGHVQKTQSSAFQQKQRQLLKRRRRCLSHHLLQQIQHSYVTYTPGGALQLSLLDVYASYRQRFEPGLPVTRAGQHFTGMPAGVGDCCAPKLLHAAAQQGLTPRALCEVWFGSPPGTATKAKQGRVIQGLDLDSSRQHCRLYGPCEKCRAVLGTMLCTTTAPVGHHEGAV